LCRDGNAILARHALRACTVHPHRPAHVLDCAVHAHEPTTPMQLLRQGSQYFAIGILQLLVDWALFVAATALGLHAVPANLLGRISGAALGFWLNGRYTFACEDGARLGWAR